LKVIIPTHDKYARLVEPHQVLFHRYCPGHNLLYAKQSGPPNTWAESLRGVIEALEEDYFILLMEDVMLMSPVDEYDLKISEQIVSEGGAVKVQLDSHLNSECYPNNDPRFVELPPSSRNRASLHPAIWHRDYLLKVLMPGFSAWNVETTGGEILKGEVMKRIVSLNKPRDLFYTANVYRKGVPFPRPECPRPFGTSGHYVNLEDVEYIRSFIDG
jgi:hypothetical protein